MSLRGRLILSYALVIVVCLGIVAVVFTVILRSYSDRVTTDRLQDMSVPIYVQARSLASGRATLREVWTNLEDQAEESNVAILMLDGGGGVIKAASPWRALGIEGLEVPPEVLSATGTVTGTWRAPGGQSFVYVSYSLASLSLTAEAEMRPATLVLAVPRRGLLATWGLILRPMLWAGLVALVFSIAVAALVARSLYRPVQRMTFAVAALADGNYDQNVPVSGPAELRRLAATFNDMAVRVKLSQQRLRDFVADVSHELKSPLTSIGGFAQALLDGTAEDESTRRRAAQIIADESRRVAAQVDELLEFSRIQSGQIAMSCDDLQVSGLVGLCSELLSTRVSGREVTLETDVPGDLCVIGDSDRLEQVIGNLLDNALKHSPPGGTIRVTARAASMDWIELSVVDEGPGIPPDNLDHVFDRFYQGAGVRTGAGLGLAIAREIVHAHGGSIRAVNGPVRGAVFTVRLPSCRRGVVGGQPQQ